MRDDTMRAYVRGLLIAVVVALGLQTALVRTQVGAPPILLVTNSAAPNQFGPYLAEILRTEGLNAFSTKDLGTVTITDLQAAQIVVLAETPLTGGQATLFSNFVAGGGRLVAMRPDTQLAPVLGLTSAGSVTQDGYIAVNPATSFADGLPTVTMPFMGSARHFQPAVGTTVLASLYNSAGAATGFPAVVRSGRTATWAYDLARSVIYTRQGDLAFAGVDHDGQPPFRAQDPFYGQIDLEKVHIPHADVQMRMLSRVIADLLADSMPLPKLWYFPGVNRTLMVVTGDSHANPQTWFDNLVNAVEARGARMSLYVNGGSSPSVASVNAWRANGHYVGMHPAGFQGNQTLTEAFDDNLTYFQLIGFGQPSPTVRNHQLEWQGWVDAAKVAASFGMGLDTSFYTQGPAVTRPDGSQAHGYINGSGLPMRFVDEAGVVVPVYQQVSSLVDEQLVVGPWSEHLSIADAMTVTRDMIDASEAGFHAALTTQFHVDYYGFGEVQPWVHGTMDYAQSLGIPMWPAERWLDYITARAATTLTNVSWAPGSNQLSFTVTVPAGTAAQSVTLPFAHNGFGLTQVQLDGAAAATTTQPINGRDTSFFNVPAGTHTVVASYLTPVPPPQHPPVAANDTASVSEGGTVTIPVLANDVDPDNDPLTVASVSPNAGATITINQDQTISYSPLAGTCGSDSFTYTIDDGRGGTSTATVTVTVTCVNGQITHSTLADFGASCAVPTGTMVTATGDGDVRLAGLQGDEFQTAPLNPAKWVGGAWTGPAYTPTISNGVLSLMNSGGAYVRSTATYPLTTLEATARFSNLPWQHVGWSSLDFASGYAIFSTYFTTTNLYARTSADGSGEQQTDLGPITPGFHRYRIERTVTSPTTGEVRYYVDDVLRATHSTVAIAPMYVYVSHSGGTAGTFDVDRLWVYGPYQGSGTYQSCTMDIGHGLSSWTTAEWSAAVPGGTTFGLRTRTSTNGTSWSAWSPTLTASGQQITSPPGRYLQYQADFSSSASAASPVLDAVTMRYGSGPPPPQQRPPVAIGDASSTLENTPVTVNVLSNDSDPDGDPITITAVTQGAKGAVTINAGQTVTYTPVSGACGSDTFTYTIGDGQGGSASATVSINIACVSTTIAHTTVADFAPACSIATDTNITAIADGEIQLAGANGDDFSGTTLDPLAWIAGTWTGGAYQPAPQNGVLSIANAAGAYVRSAGVLPVTTLETTARFSGLPWEHVGWGSLDFNGGYVIFSTYNGSTNLFARTNPGGGEVQTDLGPIPSGFRQYRITRQTGGGNDTVSYFIDGVLVAQHTVTAIPPMHIYLSHSGGTGDTLDVDRLWTYPDYRSAGMFQSCTVDGGSDPFGWTAAAWSATVPAGATLQLRTRTSHDGAGWSAWSAPLTVSGQGITSPPGRYLQYLVELTTPNPAVSPIVEAVQLAMQLTSVDATPPTISNIAVSSTTQSSALITWNTDEPATSRVEYGSTPAYGSAVSAAALVTSHSLQVSGLNGGTLYNFRVISRDNQNNESSSQNQTFTTAASGVTINDVTVTEPNAGTTNAVFTVSLAGPNTQTVTVNYATAPATATSPSDFTAASGTLTFAPGTTSLPLSIPVVGDLVSETNETFVVNLTGVTNSTIEDGQGVATIVDNDALPSLSIADVSVTEGNTGTSTASFTVSLSAASGQTVTVGYALADGTANAGSDYVTSSGTLTFAPGVTTQAVVVTINGDTAVEPNETFVVNLSNPNMATIADGQATGTILNNDLPALTIGNAAVVEGNSGTQNMVFTVTLSPSTTQTVTVSYATANGTASSSSDYASRSGTLTFPSQTTSATVTVPINGDLVSEADETFFVNLSGPVNATLAVAQGVGTITNNDTIPTVSIGDVSLSEGNSTNPTASFAVTLSAASGQTVTVNYATANGTAVAGSDYVARTGTVTFVPGDTSESVAITVSSDTALEPNETFFVNLSNPAGATILDGQGLGTILNNDAPAISITPAVSVVEGNSGEAPATFQVTLSQPTTQTVRVDYGTANGTASSTSDYDPNFGTRTFTPGTTSLLIAVMVNGDALSEANETFSVNLSNPSNGTIAVAQGIATIQNNDALPALVINNVTVTENNSGTVTATFNVTMSPASGQTVTVAFATANNTATAGADYVARTGTVTFPVGDRSEPVAITVNGDTAAELSETFFVNLSNAVNATIADAQGVGTITDNDGTMTVTAPNTAVTWAVGSTQTITWTNNLGLGASVQLEVSRNGGGSWTVIAASVPNSSATGGSFNWVVTSPTTSRARIRARWTANTNVSDISNTNFRIANPSITVNSPNGGGTWTVGNNATVSWSSNLPGTDNVRIELSTNGGASYGIVLAASTPNDTSQTFTVQNGWQTTQARVRVVWLTNTSVNDASNSNFRIQ